MFISPDFKVFHMNLETFKTETMGFVILCKWFLDIEKNFTLTTYAPHF